jgi:ParB family chromosome partitioning protein
MRLSTDVERVVISKVQVGVRRRQKLGNLRSLAKSIETHGLLHPILLRNGDTLVAGQRRLEACKLLGWTSIPARRVDGMTDEELRAVELEENTERLELLPYEASRQRFAEIRQIEADLKRPATEKPGADLPRVSGGRGHTEKAPGSRRDVASVTGISPKDQRRIEQHVAVAEQYPFMQKGDWRQYRVLEAGEKLEKLPERERPKAAAIIDQPGVDPRKAVEILGTLAAQPAPARQEIYRLAESADAHDRKVALTRAAAAPPPVDPGLVLLLDAEETLAKAAKACRVAAFKPKLTALAQGAAKLAQSFKRHLKETR